MNENRKQNNKNSNLKKNILLITILLLIIFSCFNLNKTEFKNPILNFDKAVFDNNLYGLWDIDYRDINPLMRDVTDDKIIDTLKSSHKIILNISLLNDKKALFISICDIHMNDDNYYTSYIENYKGYISNIGDTNYINLKKYEYNNYSGVRSLKDANKDFEEKGDFKLSENYNIIKYKIINNDILYVYIIDDKRLFEEINNKNIKGNFYPVEEIDKISSENIKKVDGLIFKTNGIQEEYYITIYQSQDKIIKLLKKYEADKNFFKVFKFNRDK